MWIVDIIGEEPITAQCVLDELNFHQTPQGKCTIKISLFRRKIYQRIDLKEIRSKFYQVRPVVLHLEVCLSKRTTTPNNIGEDLGGTQKQLWKEYLFVQYYKNKNVFLLSATIPIKYLSEGTKGLRSLIAPSITKGECSDARKYFSHHCANGSSQIKGIAFDQ